ncbi:MAG TPA: AAA family ATPase [Thermoanaerobaculia bacterium]
MAGLDRKQFLKEVVLNRDWIASFDEYPFSLPAIQNLESLAFDRPVTFLVGENGSGKSTLIEAIAIAWGFNAEGGSTAFRFSTAAAHSELHRHLKLIRGIWQPTDGYFLRAESFFNVATQVDELGVSGYGARSLHEQSHGESFMSLLMDRFRGNGMYILDEPEAALSPNRQLALIARMHDLVKADSQFLIATHSPIILGYPHARILLIDEGVIRPVEYEETEHYRVTRDFLLRRERMLKVLLE